MRTHRNTVVIGAGQAGLAASWWLVNRGVDHVVLERGRVAEKWRSQRWDSFTLLSPNWQTRLPGHCLRRAGPGGVHDRRRDRGVPRGLRAVVRRAGAQRRRP